VKKLEIKEIGFFDLKNENDRKILKWLREGIDKFSDIPEKLKPFFWDWLTKLDDECIEIVISSKHIYEEILKRKDDIQEWNSSVFKNLVNEIGKSLSIKGKDLWLPIRITLTGSLHGPELGLVIDKWMDKDRFFNYIYIASIYKRREKTKCLACLGTGIFEDHTCGLCEGFGEITKEKLEQSLREVLGAMFEVFRKEEKEKEK